MSECICSQKLIAKLLFVQLSDYCRFQGPSRLREEIHLAMQTGDKGGR
jgi:hypothetical protein